MKARRIQPQIFCNDVDITDTVSGCLKSMAVTDPASDESDSADLTFSDREGKWLGDWFPEKGDILDLKVKAQYWDEDTGESAAPEGIEFDFVDENPADERTMQFGKFILDSFSFSGDPVTVKLSAVSSPVDTAFKVTKRTKTWENVSLQEIAQDIAGRAGLTLFYEADVVTIKEKEQEKTEDSTFLKNLCDTYNICMKVYSDRLILFDRTKYKEKDTGITIKREEVQSWNWSTDLQGSYTGAKISYTPPKSSKKVEYQIGEDTRLLEVSGSADDAADAELKAKAALEKANHSITTMTVTTRGRFDIYAANCIHIEGFGKCDGKYYVEKVSHDITGGYTTTFELCKVE